MENAGVQSMLGKGIISWTVVPVSLVVLGVAMLGVFLASYVWVLLGKLSCLAQIMRRNMVSSSILGAPAADHEQWEHLWTRCF